MKIPSTFQQAYEDVKPTLESLEAAVRPIVEDIAARYSGVYSGRIKSLTSTFVKAEKGEYSYPLADMEDLFACTITVPQITAVDLVVRDIETEFVVVDLRQREVKPEEFAYNDVNFTLKLKETPQNRGRPFLNRTFELQVKTLLQQAWANAGHNIVYKAKRRTWGLSRVSSQLRALLEMADSVLANLEGAAGALQGDRDYPKFNRRNEIVDLLEKNWATDALPDDLSRAAEVVERYLELAGGIETKDLEEILAKNEYKKYIAAKSVSPTQAIFIILYLEEIKGRSLKKHRVMVTDEMLALCPQLTNVPTENLVNLRN